MLHDQIKPLDCQMVALIAEVEFVCLLPPGTSTGFSYFTFFEMCFNKHSLKARAKSYPFPNSMLNAKVPSTFGTSVENLLWDYCRLRGVVMEGYQNKKLHTLIAALAPRRRTRRVVGTRVPTDRERIISVNKQRRANGDL